MQIPTVNNQVVSMMSSSTDKIRQKVEFKFKSLFEKSW